MEFNKKELGNGYYLRYYWISNGLGGNHPVEITLFGGIGFAGKKITDRQGCFIHFPGVTNDNWQKKLSGELCTCTQFVCHVSEFRNDLACFSWMVQPDGRYWEDSDGFGMTPDQELWLHSLLNKKGEFVTPFSDQIPDGFDVCLCNNL